MTLHRNTASALRKFGLDVLIEGATVICEIVRGDRGPHVPDSSRTGQSHTLERRIRAWRAEHGAEKEVIFR